MKKFMPLTLPARVATQAPTARVTQACSALANISTRATDRLAHAVGSRPDLASELVLVCVALPEAVSNGGAWSVNCAVDAVRGVCRLLAAAPSALSGAAAPAQALARCWSDALGSALSMASGVVRPSVFLYSGPSPGLTRSQSAKLTRQAWLEQGANEIDLASAEDGAAVLLQCVAVCRRACAGCGCPGLLTAATVVTAESQVCRRDPRSFVHAGWDFLRP